MEAQLRARIESLLSISRHPVRNIEHQTFKRLLYRNRSQHRHGLYFRKLDHVRRLLSQIDRHVAWESIQYSLGDENGNTRRQVNQPLSISSLTLDDLKSLESLLHKLVTSVIIEAARRMVTDLVSREHFLPFAVSVIASLARLFVVERKVLSEIRGVSVEMKVVLAVDSPLIPSKNIVKYSTPLPKEEDIGLEVSVPEDFEDQKSPKDAQAPNFSLGATKASQGGAVHGKTREAQRIATTGSSKEAMSDDQEPSLYQLVANHVAPTKFSVDVRSRISVTLPEVLGNVDKNSLLKVDSDAMMRDATSVDRAVSQGSEKRKHGQTSDQIANDDIHNKSTSERAVNKMAAERPTDASDSEDIDDIFDALDDT